MTFAKFFSRPIGFVVTCVPLLSGIGCATLSQAEIKALETRELDLPFDEAYQAAMNGLFALGFAVEHSDKQSGLLTGKRSTKKASLSVTILIILPLPTVGEGTLEEAVTFKLTALNDRLTQLRMKLIVDGKSVVDKTVMTKIWQQIEREAMLESRPSDGTPASQPSSQAAETSAAVNPG